MTTAKPKLYENIKQGIIVATYVYALGLLTQLANAVVDIKVILSNHTDKIEQHEKMITKMSLDYSSEIFNQKKKDEEQDREVSKLTTSVAVLQDRVFNKKQIKKDEE